MTASGVRPQPLVTGATGGMGGEIVRELSRTHDVIAVGRSADALSELARQTGATPWVLDIERHEALLNLAVVKGHRSAPVAAGV